jgi:hypothetical protein
MVRMPQLRSPAVVTAVNVPAGGLDWPRLLLSQQARVLSLRTPQACTRAAFRPQV